VSNTFSRDFVITAKDPAYVIPTCGQKQEDNKGDTERSAKRFALAAPLPCRRLQSVGRNETGDSFESL
jgi:hypothetical protein